MGIAVAPGVAAPMPKDGPRVAAFRAPAAALDVRDVAPLRSVLDGPPESFDLGEFSVASGPWEIDWTRAYREALQTLASIDFSKRNIIIWVPGTSNTSVHPAFDRAAREAYGDDASIIRLVYEATWNMRRSMPTGLVTLLLVLEELRRRGISPDRIRLGGESQGAWIVGEAMANARFGQIAGRAVLLGHPVLARHQYLAGEDPRVQTINHIGDMVTLPINGNVTEGFDALLAVRLLKFDQLPLVFRAISANPKQGVELIKSIAFAIPGLKNQLVNPHVYDPEMPDALAFLRDGVRTGSVKPATRKA